MSKFPYIPLFKKRIIKNKTFSRLINFLGSMISRYLILFKIEIKTSFQDKLLFCDSCDQAYHMSCHRPAILRTPRGRWECDTCAAHTGYKGEEEEKLLPAGAETFFEVCYSYFLKQMGERSRNKKKIYIFMPTSISYYLAFNLFTFL